MFSLTAIPVAWVNAASTAFWPSGSPGSVWLLPIETLPTAVLAPGAALPPAGALAGGAALAAALAAAEGDEPLLLQAATIAGTDARPATPAMPLRTVRRETAS